MPIPSATSVARHRRRTYKAPLRRRIPWTWIAITISFTVGVAVAAVSDPTSQAILAVFAVGYLVALVLHKGAQHFESEADA